jgi:predicted transcriptional regulator
MEAPFMKNTQKTPNDWLSVLAAAGQGVADEVPKGFQTIAQIAKETGKSESQARIHVRNAIRLGLVEESKFRVQAGNKLYPTPHYKIR